jgi:predicted amidohydrolase
MREHSRGPESVVTVACVNFTPIWGDKAATLVKMQANIVEAASQGADFVVFPEGALQGPGSCSECAAAGGPCERHLAAAETVPGPTTEAIAALARAHDVYVVFGMPERDPDDPNTLYNAAAVVGPEGVLGTYRKVHLGSLPWVTEGITFKPGTSLPLFDTRFGPVGVQICYDLWFNPELTRLLALKGARLILNPVGSFTAPGRPDSMRATALSRAQENLVYIAVANVVGGPGRHSTGYSGDELTGSFRPDVYAGHSMITGPAFPRFGQVYTEAGTLEEIVSATLSLDRLARFETVFDYRSWRAGHLMSASKLVADEFAKLADREPASSLAGR